MRKKEHTDYNHAKTIKTQRLILLPVSHLMWKIYIALLPPMLQYI